MLKPITPQEALHNALREFENELSIYVSTALSFDTAKESIAELTKIGQEFVPHLFELLEKIKE